MRLFGKARMRFSNSRLVSSLIAALLCRAAVEGEITTPSVNTTYTARLGRPARLQPIENELQRLPIFLLR
jgi:hypothetical protein